MLGRAFRDGNNININIINNNNSTPNPESNSKNYSQSEDRSTCEVCGRKFSGVNQKFLLRRHLLTHTGERKFSCHLCPYQANQSGNLRRHLKFVHHSQTTEISSSQRISDIPTERPSQDVRRVGLKDCNNSRDPSSLPKDHYSSSDGRIGGNRSEKTAYEWANVHRTNERSHQLKPYYDTFAQQHHERDSASHSLGQVNVNRKVHMNTAESHKWTESFRSPNSGEVASKLPKSTGDDHNSDFVHQSSEYVDDSVVCLDSPYSQHENSMTKSLTDDIKGELLKEEEVYSPE